MNEEDNTVDDDMVYVVMGLQMYRDRPCFIVGIYRHHADAETARGEYAEKHKDYYYWVNNHWLN